MDSRGQRHSHDVQSPCARRSCQNDYGYAGRGDDQGRVGKILAWQKLRSRLFDFAWALWTVLFGLTIPVLWLMGSPPRAVRTVSRIWARGVLAGLSLIVGLNFREQGRAHVPKTPCLIICNHQSTWETLAALSLFPDVAIIAKRELLQIPVMGWFLRRSPMIIIDRGAAASALRTMMAEGAAALAAGRSVLIFPEGTRRDPNEPIQFKRGVELLYKSLGVPALPMVVNSGRFWGVGKGFKQPGTITVTYLPVLEPGLSIPEFTQRGEQLMQEEQSRQRAVSLDPRSA